MFTKQIMKRITTLVTVVTLCACGTSAFAASKTVILATTTSTQDSGPVSYTHLTLPTNREV